MFIVSKWQLDTTTKPQFPMKGLGVRFLIVMLLVFNIQYSANVRHVRMAVFFKAFLLKRELGLRCISFGLPDNTKVALINMITLWMSKQRLKGV